LTTGQTGAQQPTRSNISPPEIAVLMQRHPFNNYRDAPTTTVFDKIQFLMENKVDEIFTTLLDCDTVVEELKSWSQELKSFSWVEVGQSQKRCIGLGGYADTI